MRDRIAGDAGDGADALLMFAPEQWGQVDLFRAVNTTTYTFSPHQQRVLAGVENHSHKAVTLLWLAEALRPTLQLDDAELEENGFTPARNAKNVAAIVEGVITELYSVIDCAAKVLHFVYGPRREVCRDRRDGCLRERIRFRVVPRPAEGTHRCLSLVRRATENS
jgi:hypothetical protein